MVVNSLIHQTSQANQMQSSKQSSCFDAEGAWQVYHLPKLLLREVQPTPMRVCGQGDSEGEGLTWEQE